MINILTKCETDFLYNIFIFDRETIHDCTIVSVSSAFVSSARTSSSRPHVISMETSSSSRSLPVAIVVRQLIMAAKVSVILAQKHGSFLQTKGAQCFIVKHTYMSRKHHRRTLEKRGLTDNLQYTVAGVTELVSLLMSWVNVSVCQ